VQVLAALFGGERPREARPLQRDQVFNPQGMDAHRSIAAARNQAVARSSQQSATAARPLASSDESSVKVTGMASATYCH